LWVVAIGPRAPPFMVAGRVLGVMSWCMLWRHIYSPPGVCPSAHDGVHMLVAVLIWPWVAFDAMVALAISAPYMAKQLYRDLPLTLLTAGARFAASCSLDWTVFHFYLRHDACWRLALVAKLVCAASAAILPLQQVDGMVTSGLLIIGTIHAHRSCCRFPTLHFHPCLLSTCIAVVTLTDVK
jgi:hypothetical protein